MEEKPLVLLVDDEPGILKILTIQLKHSGLDVISTTSGEQAVELVREKNPAVILLDVLMPEVSGLEVLDRVRAFSQVPVIIFTANPKIIEVAKNIGANGYISKPCDPDALTEKIKATIRESKNKAG